MRFNAKLCLSFLALVSPLFIAGCSGSLFGGSTKASSILADQSYSTSTLNGIYSVMTFNDPNHGGIGTIQLDGKGNLTGTVTQNGPNASYSVECQYSVKGTYSIQSTGLGTASLTESSSPSCNVPGNSIITDTPFTYSIAAGQQGQIVMFNNIAGERPNFGWAVKQ